MQTCKTPQVEYVLNNLGIESKLVDSINKRLVARKALYMSKPESYNQEIGIYLNLYKTHKQPIN